MPPLQTCIPAAFAACMAAILSSVVCVVQIFGKKFLEASRLLCIRDAPAFFRSLYCAAVNNPQDTQISMEQASFILRIELHKEAMSESFNERPEVTIE